MFNITVNANFGVTFSVTLDVTTRRYIFGVAQLFVADDDDCVVSVVIKALMAAVTNVAICLAGIQKQKRRGTQRLIMPITFMTL
jgi:hypothetical protein